MTKEQFIEHAIELGWKPDRYKHLQHVSASGRQYRLKIQKISWRLEGKGASSGQWGRIRGQYYSATDPRGGIGAVVPVPPEPKSSPT